MITLQGRELGRVRKVRSKVPYKMGTKMEGQFFDHYVVGDKSFIVNSSLGFDPKKLFLLELEETANGLSWVGDFSYEQEKEIRSLAVLQQRPMSLNELPL